MSKYSELESTSLKIAVDDFIHKQLEDASNSICGRDKIKLEELREAASLAAEGIFEKFQRSGPLSRHFKTFQRLDF